ncbi:uncharacterized protein LOC111392375 [Olea europaea var. sylvestris]|uniref:uncharacterized protein LOC111392375 n=1 Tax=Olea europaea var. sylvestris TaxID=158386 RepID=UPI000C1CF284|nr:uncharacterized protein LOC111392375 [Olea europaea var. sylvestris]
MTCNTPYYATIVTTNVVMTITTITCNIHCYTHHHQDQIVISPSPSPVDSTFNLTTHLPSHHNNRTPNLLPQKQISSQKLTARRKLLQKLLTTSESSIIPSTQKRVLSNNESSTIVSTQVKSSHNASKPNLMGPSIVVLGYDSNDHGHNHQKSHPTPTIGTNRKPLYHHHHYYLLPTHVPPHHNRYHHHHLHTPSPSPPLSATPRFAKHQPPLHKL